jgi:hypothetical protein
MVRAATPRQQIRPRVPGVPGNGSSAYIDSATVVVPADEMDDATFIRHMNKRHRNSLGGLPYLWETCDPYVTACWRAFHEQLHRWHITIRHEHG